MCDILSFVVRAYAILIENPQQSQKLTSVGVCEQRFGGLFVHLGVHTLADICMLCQCVHVGIHAYDVVSMCFVSVMVPECVCLVCCVSAWCQCQHACVCVFVVSVCVHICQCECMFVCVCFVTLKTTAFLYK